MTRHATGSPTLAQGAHRINRRALTAMQDPAIIWYVGVVRSRMEMRVQREAVKSGVPAWVPLKRRRYLRRSRTHAPALPGYVFFGHRSGDESLYNLIHNIRGMSGLLGADGQPYPVTGARLMRFWQENRRQFAGRPPAEGVDQEDAPQLQAGDRAQIIGGPFAGHAVNILSVRGRRANIMLPLFDGAVRIDVGQLTGE